MQIFSAKTSRETPPKTVKSCEKTKTLAAEDRPVAGDDRVAVRPPLEHPEVRLAMADVPVELDERARIEQLLDALAGEQLPLGALALDRLLAARVPRSLAQLLEPRELGLGRLHLGGHVPSVLNRLTP